MNKKDKRIDSYIAKSAPFAKPILNHLRGLIHKADPDVKETTKWGFPHFVDEGIVCSMASFKEHCTFIFWKAALLPDSKNIFKRSERAAMGQLGRLEKLSDLPPDNILIKYLKEAVQFNKANVKVQRKANSALTKELKIPDYFISELKKNKESLKNFENLSYSHKKEYVEWVTEAKTEETRNKRIATSVEWLSEGKVRNWKYVK
ncbi:MAG TPA: YdeI/OmpD-associated family protein [Ignavibacteriaceae bacterium]|nr:YdeI/OmpD-associated family protein [Ignavibacteriaceae bacterium]